MTVAVGECKALGEDVKNYVKDQFGSNAVDLSDTVQGGCKLNEGQINNLSTLGVSLQPGGNLVWDQLAVEVSTMVNGKKIKLNGQVGYIFKATDKVVSLEYIDSENHRLTVKTEGGLEIFDIKLLIPDYSGVPVDDFVNSVVGKPLENPIGVPNGGSEFEKALGDIGLQVQ